MLMTCGHDRTTCKLSINSDGNCILCLNELCNGAGCCIRCAREAIRLRVTIL